MLPTIPAEPRFRCRRAAVAALRLCLAAGLAAGLGAQQDATPLAPAARASGHAIAELPATTTNIDWEEVRVVDLRLLAALPALQRLQINPNSDDDGGWPQVTPDDLAPLVALPALETLTVPYNAHLSVAHLQRLAGCKRLASLTCINEAFTLDAAIAGAFADFPALRTLDLSVIRVTAEGLAALAKVQRLQRLELDHCRDLDAAGMAAVAGLGQLRSLELAGVGKADLIAAMRGGGAPPTWALDVTTMKRLAAMPNLRELGLRECTLVPHLLAELPAKLTSLRLQGWQVDAAALTDLRRLVDLRELDLRPAGKTTEEQQQVVAAAADLLGSLHLEQLRWYGEAPPDLRRAIAGQADLRELELPLIDDLGFLTKLPKLERLVLWPRLAPADGQRAGPPHPIAADLMPLQASKALRVVTCCDRTLDAAAVAELQRAVGSKIRLQLR